MSSKPIIQAQHTLRLTNLITFPPAFVMLLVHGLVAGGAFPAVALIPLAISALLALYLFDPNVVAIGGSAIRLAAGHIVAIDLLLALSLFVMCVCCWVNVPRWGYDGGQVMLGTYGSVWVMINCAIHAYVAFLRFPDLVALFAAPCPKCGKAGSHSHSSGQRRFMVENGYVQFAPEEGLPVYHDDEAGLQAGTPAKSAGGYKRLS